MEKKSRILHLGVYGMEMVECGGTLCKNALNGGVSHSCIMFAGETMREDLQKASKILNTSVDFLDFNTYDISVCSDSIEKIVYQIRKFRPNIIITQDPEHSLSDLDPGRRIAMTVIFEGIAHASRTFALEKMPELTAWPIPTIYYMTPERPNCLVNIAQVWDYKSSAMESLRLQMEFLGRLYESEYNLNDIKKIVPNWDELDNYFDKGNLITKQMESLREDFYFMQIHF